MSLYETLMSWPKERLAKELQGEARANAALQRRVLELECELFWLKTPSPALLHSTTGQLLREISECAGGMVNGNRLAQRAKEAVHVDGTALGLRLIVDSALPPNTAEIRGVGGKLVARIENFGAPPAATVGFGTQADRLRTPEEAACWCSTCRPVMLDDCRMVLCPTCGNKRCPRANDHRNSCTGSNEPGQTGSAYPHWPSQKETAP